MAAFASSYIKTEGSQVTRAADAASITGANFSGWYSQGQGSLSIELSSMGYSSFNSFVSIGSSSTKALTIGVNSSNIPRFVVEDGTVQANINSIPATALVKDTFVKMSAAYKTNDFSVVLNGTQGFTDDLGTVPFADQMVVGGAVGFARSINGRIKKLSYYSRRLSNAELQALTS